MGFIKTNRLLIGLAASILFFRMTGRDYLGPLVTCLVFIMILSTNTVVYLPIK